MSGGDLLQLIAYLVGVGAVYGGIRADLKYLHSSIDAAHRRLDDHIQGEVAAWRRRSE